MGGPRKALTVAIAAAVALAAGGSIAVADDLIIEGDDLVAIDTSGTVNLGSVCTNTTKSDEIVLALERTTNGGPNIFKNASTVTVTASTSAPSRLQSPSMVGTFQVPAVWSTQDNNAEVLSFEVDPESFVGASFTFVAGVTAGPFSGTISYTATGTNMNDGGITRSATLTVTALVVNSGPLCDQTAPVIVPSISGTLGTNDWYRSDVTVSWTITDASSYTSSGCDTAIVNSDTPGQTYTCTATDSAGNSASKSVTIKRDATAPTISAAVAPPRPAGGWWNINSGAPTVTYSCGDTGGSGLASCSGVHSFGDGADQSHTGTAVDNAGNTATTAVSDIDVDLIGPSITANLDVQPSSTGWYNAGTGAPTVSYTCSDDIVGTCPASHTFGEGADQHHSASVSDGAGNTATDGVTDIDVDLTAPTISAAVTPDPAASGWWNIATGAPTVTYTCADTGSSGLASCTEDHTFQEGANQSHQGTATDNAGNSATDEVTGIDVDLTAPTISAAIAPEPAASGWWNIATGPPTVAYTCADTGSSELATCTSPHQFGNGANQFHEGTATDHAGNSATDGVNGIDVDLIAPTISAAVTPDAAASGWWNIATGAPTVEYACADTGSSGLATCTEDHTFPEGANQSHEGTATDNAGNSATDGVTNIDVDLTAPGLTWNGAIPNGANYYFGSVPPAPTCDASDSLSGPDGCTVAGHGTTVGSHTLTATALDKAANERKESTSYSVLAWTLKGFYQPVDMGNVLNTVKGGSTVPLKFEVFAGGTELTDVGVVKSFTYAMVACDSVNAAATEDAIETVTSGNTVLRYDATGGQFIQNWQTPKNSAGKCYRVTLITDDGSSIVAYFKMK